MWFGAPAPGWLFQRELLAVPTEQLLPRGTASTSVSTLDVADDRRGGNGASDDPVGNVAADPGADMCNDGDAAMLCRDGGARRGLLLCWRVAWPGTVASFAVSPIELHRSRTLVDWAIILGGGINHGMPHHRWGRLEPPELLALATAGCDLPTRRG